MQLFLYRFYEQLKQAWEILMHNGKVGYSSSFIQTKLMLGCKDTLNWTTQ